MISVIWYSAATLFGYGGSDLFIHLSIYLFVCLILCFDCPDGDLELGSGQWVWLGGYICLGGGIQVQYGIWY